MARSDSRLRFQVPRAIPADARQGATFKSLIESAYNHVPLACATCVARCIRGWRAHVEIHFSQVGRCSRTYN